MEGISKIYSVGEQGKTFNVAADRRINQEGKALEFAIFTNAPSGRVKGAACVAGDGLLRMSAREDVDDKDEGLMGIPTAKHAGEETMVNLVRVDGGLSSEVDTPSPSPISFLSLQTPDQQDKATPERIDKSRRVVGATMANSSSKERIANTSVTEDSQPACIDTVAELAMVANVPSGTEYGEACVAVDGLHKVFNANGVKEKDEDAIAIPMLNHRVGDTMVVFPNVDDVPYDHVEQPSQVAPTGGSIGNDLNQIYAKYVVYRDSSTPSFPARKPVVTRKSSPPSDKKPPQPTLCKA